uniref:RelA/SpoT domain-containing protein n=1 Tax=Physcomitrium patens TaxID=3218 RepID=A0A7I4EBA8_PHYPA
FQLPCAAVISTKELLNSLIFLFSLPSPDSKNKNKLSIQLGLNHELRISLFNAAVNACGYFILKAEPNPPEHRCRGGNCGYYNSKKNKISSFVDGSKTHNHYCLGPKPHVLLITVCDTTEADRLRTMILAMVDVRVVLIKIADRLHNLRTLEALPSHKQIGIAKETLEIFAPLANRLGIWSWKAEMEDLCFKCLKPVDHENLSIRLSERCREGLVMSSIRYLDEALRVGGVQFIDLCGRPKNLYSVYKKMMKKKRSPDEILDVRGLRLIVTDEESCYQALEVVHQLWRCIPGKTKDYIVDSKPNGCKSLHTVVIGSDGYPLEVQIRTMKMHHQAEYGLAAHWRYKEDNSEHSAFSSERVEWARWVLTWQSEIMDTKLRVSPLAADLKPPCPFPVHNKECPYAGSCCEPVMRENDPVYVIKMENEHILVRELPPGSTVGDLVRSKHSDMNSLVVDSRSANDNGLRVKVNHEFVDTMEPKLKMGDFVEVMSTREQLKRLYLDGGSSNEDTNTTWWERSASMRS